MKHVDDEPEIGASDMTNGFGALLKVADDLACDESTLLDMTLDVDRIEPFLQRAILLLALLARAIGRTPE